MVHTGFLGALGICNFGNHNHGTFQFTSNVMPLLDINREDLEKPLAYQVLCKKLTKLLETEK